MCDQVCLPLVGIVEEVRTADFEAGLAGTLGVLGFEAGSAGTTGVKGFMAGIAGLAWVAGVAGVEGGFQTGSSGVKAAGLPTVPVAGLFLFKTKALKGFLTIHKHFLAGLSVLGGLTGF